MSRVLNLKVKGPFRRYLTACEADTLAKLINKTFSLTLDGRAVLETARKTRGIENRMVGRIAGDIQDHILNYYMIKQAALKLPDEAAHAEIGVLFGGSLLIMMHALKDAGVERNILAIDPLDSYYGENEDPVTLLPITHKNVLENIRRLGFSSKTLQLIATPSQLEQTVRAAKAYKLATLYIDGDHSFEGLKLDWDNYSPLVLPGGYVLIDNYHDNYEGIDHFVDDDLIPNQPDWVVVCKLWRSILFMRK